MVAEPRWSVTLARNPTDGRWVLSPGVEALDAPPLGDHNWGPPERRQRTAGDEPDNPNPMTEAIMQRLSAQLAIPILLAAAAFAATPAGADHGPHGTAAASPAPTLAIAVLHPTAGNTCHGTLRFVQEGEKVHVTADIEGLKPNQQHAMHVHEYGDCSAPDAASAGSHYNPEGHPHGLPATSERHAGDLGNLQADAAGKAHYEITITNASVAGALNPILGRAVIVHEKIDDGGQPVGNAGARIACGIIGIAKPPAPAK